MKTDYSRTLKLKRVAVRAICLLYGLTMVFTLISALRGSLHEYVALDPVPPWFYIYSYAAFGIYSLGFIGTFFFKKKVLIALTVLTFLSHPILLSMGLGNWISLIVDIAVFGSLLWMFRKPLEESQGQDRA